VDPKALRVGAFTHSFHTHLLLSLLALTFSLPNSRLGIQTKPIQYKGPFTDETPNCCPHGGLAIGWLRL
jgi:hypothetical protein